MKKSMLNIGFPTNKRLEESLAPLRNAFDLETGIGVLKSRQFPNAVFRPLRAQDSANMLYSGESPLDMAIGGQDLMIVERIRQERYFSQLPPDPMIIKDMEAIFASVSEILRWDQGGLVRMYLLIRKEDEEKLLQARDAAKQTDARNSTIITSYPDIAEVAVLKPLTDYIDSLVRLPLMIRRVNGKVESILRFRDYQDADFAIDIVKSGKTAEEMEVKPFGEPLLESRTGLYRGWNSISKSPQLVEDFIAFFKECLQKAGFDWREGAGEKFVDALRPWTPPEASKKK